MKKQVYSLYDVKSEFFLGPLLFHDDEDAKREFSKVFERPESNYAKYSEDYKVYRLGSFDDHSGSLEMPKNGLPVFISELSLLDFHSKGKGQEKGA